MLQDFTRDDLVASLLLLYGLHPDDLQTRVTRAVEKLQPALLSQGRVVEFMRIDEGVVRLRLRKSGNGCHSSSSLKTTVEDAIYGAAPDAEEIIIEDAEAEPALTGFVPIGKLQAQSQ